MADSTEPGVSEPTSSPRDVVATRHAARRAGGISLRRRLSALAVVLVGAALVLGAVLYLRGGGRLSGSGGSLAGSVVVGQEFHTMVEPETGGRTVELLSARPVGNDAGFRVDVSLVDVGSSEPIGASRGPLGPGYQHIALRGHRLRAAGLRGNRYWLDVRGVASTPGVHRLRAIAVTYRAGFGRTRTAILPTPLCLSARNAGHPAPPLTHLGWCAPYLTPGSLQADR